MGYFKKLFHDENDIWGPSTAFLVSDLLQQARINTV